MSLEPVTFCYVLVSVLSFLYWLFVLTAKQINPRVLREQPEPEPEPFEAHLPKMNRPTSNGTTFSMF